MKRLRQALGALSILVCLPAISLAAAPSGPGLRLDAQPQGRLLEISGTGSATAQAANQAEIVRFGESLAPALLRVPLEGEVQIDEWPVAPGERAPVVLTRFDAYAPDAKIWKVGRGGALTEVPRSKLAFFRGQAAGDAESRVFVAVDPATSTFSGFSSTAAGLQEIRPLREIEPRALASEHLVGASEPLAAGTGTETAWSCDQSGAPLEFLENKAEASTTLPLFEEAITSLHTAAIAVDTDNELINTKFGGNVTAATDFIASLFASMTVIYERDLLIRLVQGTTFLRAAADPYTSTGSTFDKLQEFGNYWNANNSGVNRAAAAMLSARGGAGASGIAWLDVLCSKTSGYSYTQLYTSGTTVRTGEVMVVAHEIGHNFGSPHTQCYNPPLDNCYNTEAGCYTGTKSCPAPTTINGVPNVTGTLMSYCHLGGIGCTTSNVFHPGSVALLQPKIQAKVNVCIFPAGGTTPPEPTISTFSPASGTTAGGTVTTITGANFQSGATVTFGGTAASSVTFNSSTKLTVTAPAHATGSVSVVVTNPGGQSATKNPGFFYAPPAVATDFFTVTPCRLLDTRNANGTWGGPALGPSTQRSFPATGRCGVPATATTVVVNVTVTGPTASGYLSIFPGNAFDLGTSLLSLIPGRMLANNATLRLATDGTGTIVISNNSTGTTNVVVDVTGYY
ncbi:MAG TPA: M12 family metallo-peptidase [Thermoanaerobaculia bacterium]|nr:M12 family metallo-peptidase [Thermoanaerobaculia bacterium]